MILKGASGTFFSLVIIFLFGMVEAHGQVIKPVDPFLNGTFPSTIPGANGAWEVIDFLPDCQVASPVKIIDIPGENAMLVLSKIGEVWKLDLDQMTHWRVLDIKDRCFKLGDGGAVGIALHPRFNTSENDNYIFLYYRYKPDPDTWDTKGFNRLSKFKWINNAEGFDKNSEEILIQQYDRDVWHNGGGLFFGSDGFLYVTVGDEGNADELDIQLSTQRLDGGFFSGVLRLDVDNDPDRSHPIRRQPLALGIPPSGWGDTYSQGYSIPNDNPWLDAEGDRLEEFFAIGLRSPYSAYYDHFMGEIWVTDVGSDKIEEINIVEKGDNFQWPYYEGNIASDNYQKPDSLIGSEKKSFFFYTRELGSVVIGGAVYRGGEFLELDESYLFADYISKRIFSLKDTTQDPVIIIDDVNNYGVNLPEENGITSLHVSDNGKVLITILSSDWFLPGKILALHNKSIVPDPPSRLSELNVFKDLHTLDPIDAFIPYEVNVPLWSDGAIKNRWVAIPNDGTFDESSEQILFQAEDIWKFPEGTVFMKHFSLPTDISDPTIIRPLETRFIIIGENGIAYGLTYKWDEQGDDATLLQSHEIELIDIFDNGIFQYSQEWYFPSRNNCLTCHNSQAGFVLGMNTQQLNREVAIPGVGQNINQLSYFNSANIFNFNIDNPQFYPRNYHLSDAEIPLELRIRSYWDANCSGCHRDGGSVITSDIDLRLKQPLNAQNVIEYPVMSNASRQEFIITPGDHTTSELWVRDASYTQNKMPPLARNQVDKFYVDSLAKWIDNYTVEIPDDNQIIIEPNPSSGRFRIKVGPDWLPEFDVRFYDMEGRLMHELHGNNYTTYFDLNHLHYGIYFAVIKSNGKREVHKVILTK